MAPPLRHITEDSLFLLCLSSSSSLLLHKKRWNPALVPHSITWRGTLIRMGWLKGLPPERPRLPPLTEVCTALGGATEASPGAGNIRRFSDCRLIIDF